MRFSIVIPTYQRRDVVRRTVAALERQQHRDFEVIVVIDGSTDGTTEALRELQVPFPLTVLQQENAGSGVARNVGAAAASRELLLFLDDDMEADPAMLLEHERSHRGGAGVVLGDLPIHPDSPKTILSQGVGRWATRRRDELIASGGQVPLVELITGQMSISRAAFRQLGGFDVSFTRDGLYGGEDLDFGYRARRAGLEIVFNPDAVSRQYYAVDPAAFTRRTREAGRSNEQLAAKHPELAPELTAGLVFTTRRSQLILGALAVAPAVLSWPLRALAAHLVHSGRLDFRVYRLFYGVQTMEYQRGARQARRKLRAGHAVVLAYHAIADLQGDPLLSQYGVPPSSFADQLDRLARRGHRFIGLDMLLRALDGELTLPRGATLVTFDDAYDDLLAEAVPILGERGIPAVAFAVAGRIGETNEWDRALGGRSAGLLDAEGLREVAVHGVAIGSHGMWHRRLVGLDAGEMEEELEGSASHLAAIGLPRPVALSYPYGVWSPEVATSAAEAGYRAAFTVEPGVVRGDVRRHAIPRVEVLASDTPRRLRLKLTTAGWPARLRQPVLRLFRVRQ